MHKAVLILALATTLLSVQASTYDDSCSTYNDCKGSYYTDGDYSCCTLICTG